MSIAHPELAGLATTSRTPSAGDKVKLPDFVLSRVRGKRVLDIGSIGHDFQARQRLGTFYLDQLSQVAAYAKGIDILESDVDEARSQGYNVELGDAESFTDVQPYDIVFAGEIIEHLSNPGRFLQCCDKNLTERGTLIVTTPNAFSLSRVVKVIARMTNEPPVNPEHTCYYTPETLSQLVYREGFAVEELYYADYDYGRSDTSVAKQTMLKLNRLATDWRPQFSQSIVAVIKRGR